MEKLEAEKRHLQEKLEQPVSAPMSPRNIVPVNSQTTNQASSASMIMSGVLNLPTGFPASSEQATNLTEHIINLRREVSRLKTNLEKSERDHKENMAKIIREEKAIKDENVRLQRRLQMEVDRREALCRHLSESESSLEMDDERHFNESSRVRTVSSPIPGFLVASSCTYFVCLNKKKTLKSYLNFKKSASSSHISSGTSGNANNINNQNIACSAPISSLVTMQPVTTVERCPTCNQLKTLSISSNCTGGMMNITSPGSFLPSKQQGNPQCHGYNPLTASSSLSSSTSSINSSNKQNQNQPVNIQPMQIDTKK